VLWTGVEGDREGLDMLAKRVAAAARRAKAPPAQESRKYEPHLTLARCRAPADVRTLVATLAGFAGTPWTAGEIYLIRSRLQEQPRYETLGAWPLAHAPSQAG
jgi:2'-5' RNA ligase